MELALIPPGTFLMGAPEDEAEREADEGPLHRVVIANSFLMGRYEVTQEQWEVVMGDNSSHFSGDRRLPVERVSWSDCVEFCKRLSARLGRVVRPPSEAEWEYACRAGTTTAFNVDHTITTKQTNFDGDFTYGHRGHVFTCNKQILLECSGAVMLRLSGYHQHHTVERPPCHAPCWEGVHRVRANGQGCRIHSAQVAP